MNFDQKKNKKKAPQREYNNSKSWNVTHMTNSKFKPKFYVKILP